MENEITYHTCSKCGEEKPLTKKYFYKRKDSPTGYRYDCKECRKNQSSKNYYENPEKKIEYSNNYYYDNIEIIKIRKKEYNSRKEVKKNKNIRIANRKIKDPLFKLGLSISKCIFKKIKLGGYTKKSKTYEYLKCDYETFKEHIESQFIDGMSWDNQGEWHLDHYYPISLAQTEEDMYIFNYYTNFQPLWAEDNLSKSNNVPDGFEEWYEMMRKKVL